MIHRHMPFGEGKPRNDISLAETRRKLAVRRQEQEKKDTLHRLAEPACAKV